MLVLNALDSSFQRGEFVLRSQRLDLIVVGTACQADQLEQGIKWKIVPQFGDYPGFFFAFLSRLIASSPNSFNFFR